MLGRWTVAPQMRLLILALLAVLVGPLAPRPAQAWKPYTHVYLAEQALQEAIQTGRVTIYRTDYANSQLKRTANGAPIAVGSYALDPDMLGSLRQYAPQFRAGVFGPDAYPDILTGQEMIHEEGEVQPGERDVDVNHGGPYSDEWLRWLWDRAHDEPGPTPAKAFVAGFLSHAAGDMYGHGFINLFTGAQFNFLPDNAVKHFVLEGYIGKRTPGMPPGAFAASIDGVQEFIYQNMINAAPGSYLDSRLLTGDNSVVSLPRIFSDLRAWVQHNIDDYYAQKDDYDRRVNEKLQDANNCSWYDITCSSTLDYAEAAAIEAEKLAFMAIHGPICLYEEAWRDNIDEGLREWPVVSHRVAIDLFYHPDPATPVNAALADPGNPNTADATDALGAYARDFIIPMVGFPKVVSWILDAISSVTDLVNSIIGFLIAPIQNAVDEIKQDLVDYVFVKAIGMTEAQLADYLTNPQTYFNQVMNNPGFNRDNGQLSSLADFNQNQIHITDSGFTNPAERFDYTRFPAAYNTTTMIKLLLMSQSEVNRLMADLGSGVRMDEPNAMLGFLNAFDNSNQWNRNAKMILARDCDAYHQVFMRQPDEAKFADTCTIAPLHAAPDSVTLAGGQYQQLVVPQTVPVAWSLHGGVPNCALLTLINNEVALKGLANTAFNASTPTPIQLPAIVLPGLTISPAVTQPPVVKPPVALPPGSILLPMAGGTLPGAVNPPALGTGGVDATPVLPTIKFQDNPPLISTTFHLPADVVALPAPKVVNPSMILNIVNLGNLNLQLLPDAIRTDGQKLVDDPNRGSVWLYQGDFYYFAPDHVACDNHVQIVANANDGTGRSAVVKVHLLRDLSLDPQSVTLKPRAQQQFTATPADVPIKWSVVNPVAGDHVGDTTSAEYVSLQQDIATFYSMLSNFEQKYNAAQDAASHCAFFDVPCLLNNTALAVQIHAQETAYAQSNATRINNEQARLRVLDSIYVAPASVSAPRTVTIRADATDGSLRFATATVMLLPDPPIHVEPVGTAALVKGHVQLHGGQSVAFQVVPPTTVIWTITDPAGAAGITAPSPVMTVALQKSIDTFNASLADFDARIAAALQAVNTCKPSDPNCNAPALLQQASQIQSAKSAFLIQNSRAIGLTGRQLAAIESTYTAPMNITAGRTVTITARANDGSGRTAAFLVDLLPGPAMMPGAPRVSLTNVNGAPGAQVTIPITADGTLKNVAGAQITLQFGNVLTVSKTGAVSPGGLIAGAGATLVADTSTAGQVQIKAMGSVGQNGPGTLAVVTATIPAATKPGTYQLALTRAALTDPKGTSIPANVVNGTLTVVDANIPRVTVPSVSAAPGSSVTLEFDTGPKVRNVAGAKLTLQFGQPVSINGATGVGLGPLITGPGAGVTADVTPSNAGLPAGLTDQVRITALGTQGQNGPGALATVTITIPADATEGAYPLTLLRGDMTDPAGNAIPAQLVSGTLTVTRSKPTVGLRVKDLTGSPGSLVQVEVDADAMARNVAGAQLTVSFGAIGTFDPGSLAPGALITGADAAVVGNGSTPGQLIIGEVGTQPQDGPGALATFRLKLDPTLKPGTYPITLTQAGLNDGDGADIPVNAVAGTLTVAGRLIGDANGDGKITIADATLALRFAIGLADPSADQLAALDLNGDGRIEISEVTRLLRLAIGLSG